MKNRYLLTLASTALLATATLPATAQQARMPIPGVRAQLQVMNNSQAQRPALTPMEQVRRDKARMARARRQIHLASLPEMKAMAQAQQAAREEAAPAKKKVLTSVDRYTPDDGQTVNRTYRYDAFGRALDYYSFSTGFSSADSHYTTQYTYADNTSGKWTEMQEWKEPNDGSPAYLSSKECRTLGADGLVTDTERWQNRRTVTGEDNVMLASKRHFEPLKTDPTQAVLTRSTSYKTDGSGLASYDYACLWFDYMKDYAYASNNTGRVELTQQDNVLMTTRYTTGADGQEQVAETRSLYFDTDPVTHQGYQTGSLTINYQNGAPDSGDGVLYEMQYNTPEEGFYTFVQKEWEDGEWVPTAKYECNYNYLNEHFSYIPYTKDYEAKGYTMKGGKYKQFVTLTYQWMEHNIQREFLYWNETGSGSLTDTYYTNEGVKVGDQAYLLDNGYAIQTSDDTYTYYMYHDNDGYLQYALRSKTIGYDDIAGQATTQNMWYEVMEGGEWVPAAGKTLDMGGYPHLQKCTFDDKGRLAAIDAYTDKDTRQATYRYTYYDTTPIPRINNGYEEMLSYYSTYGPVDEVVYKVQTQYYVDGNGCSVYATKAWNHGVLDNALQTVVNPKGRTDTYNYKNGRWVWASAQSDDLVTDEVVDGLNRHTVITNTIDNKDGGGVYPQTKTVTITSPDDDSLQGTETYHMADGQWVGDTKQDTWVVKQPNFSYTIPSGWRENAEYFSYVYLSDTNYTPLGYRARDCSRTYKWQDGQWMLAESTIFQYTLDGNTFSWDNTIDSTPTDGELSTNHYSYVRDDEGRLLSMTSELCVKENNEEIYHRTNSDVYTYNEDGLVATNEYKLQTVSSYSPRTYHYIDTYHYADIDVAGGIDAAQATGAAQPFTVRGRTISATTASATLTLYNAQGQQVAASASGTLTAPAPGLYIVSDGSARAKVLVR